jgi:protein required for attachment to host cells
MLIATDTLLILANGQEAKFIANAGTAESPRLQLVSQTSHVNAASHELGRDRPGRAMSSETSRRTSFEQKDLHQAAETAFLETVVAQAANHIERGDYKKVILAAETQALGIMRGMIKGGLQSAMVREIPKDYTKTAMPDLQGILAALD